MKKKDSQVFYIFVSGKQIRGIIKRKIVRYDIFCIMFFLQKMFFLLLYTCFVYRHVVPLMMFRFDLKTAAVRSAKKIAKEET